MPSRDPLSFSKVLSASNFLFFSVSSTTQLTYELICIIETYFLQIGHNKKITTDRRKMTNRITNMEGIFQNIRKNWLLVSNCDSVTFRFGSFSTALMRDFASCVNRNTTGMFTSSFPSPDMANRGHVSDDESAILSTIIPPTAPAFSNFRAY